MSTAASPSESAGAPEALSTSERLTKLAEESPRPNATLGWILDGLHERAFGIFLLVLALPCCIPFLYGVPQVVALPLLFVSGQLAAGRRAPWLPERLRAREVPAARLEELARRAGPYLRWFEKLSSPRLGVLTRRPLDRVVAVVLLVFSVSILLPIPGTNTVPGIGVAIVALGFLQRDGLLVVIGSAIGSAWIALLIAAATGLAGLALGG